MAVVQWAEAQMQGVVEVAAMQLKQNSNPPKDLLQAELQAEPQLSFPQLDLLALLHLRK